ncbi:hypothetical protein OK348_12695 [Flavobacterium sp. MXW15]|uniref:Uncharacterized protein n=1 Tax=Xanthomonas chitinilytica TaxID=2989819 RepID=A0ABT3JWL0_9XANT|nr:hypothetical protein [Xanthomonas sp. H13-6]MCW4455643.1 hypothetical protein [Flavobacterium sp. MXW15]MCW4472871.1 hypothetical protein [Xanthomonas sp. H13-6]
MNHRLPPPAAPKKANGKQGHLTSLGKTAPAAASSMATAVAAQPPGTIDGIRLAGVLGACHHAWNGSSFRRRNDLATGS